MVYVFKRFLQLVVFLSAMVVAPTFSFSNDVPKEDVVKEYEAMVRNSRSMSDSFDFVKFRTLFALQPSYKPYALQPIKDFSSEIEKMKERNLSLYRLRYIYHKEYIALPEAQVRMATLMEKIGSKEEADYHNWMAKGLISAILYKGRDGRGPKTAYKVLNVTEEYFIASQFIWTKDIKVRTDKQFIGTFDIFSGPLKSNGQMVEIWFDVSKIFGTEM